MLSDYQGVRLNIRDGDIAGFRNGGVVELAGCWTHIAMCLWVKQTLMLAECREWHGGRMVTLSSQVTRCPGRIDIFQPSCERNVAAYAAELVARQAGHDYGWGSIRIAALKRLFFLGRRTRMACRDTTPSKWSDPKHCSQTVVWAFRKTAKRAGSDYFPCEGMADKCVEPTPLVESVDSRGVGHFRLVFEGLKHMSAA